MIPQQTVQPQQAQAKGLTMPFQAVDYASALALAQSKDVLEDLFYSLCGLQRHKQGEKIFLKRISKPMFTPKYTNNLVNFLGISINRITARTSFKSERVHKFMLTISDSLREELACNGFHNLISDKVWEQILEFAKEDDAKETIWKKKHGVTWEYDNNISDSMVNIIKRDCDLQSETFGQAVLLRNIYNQLLIFIEGALNRSVDALTLEHEKIIHKESVITNNRPGAASDEGRIDKVKRGIAGLFGG